jgi:lysophospholipase L1-like esterase
MPTSLLGISKEELDRVNGAIYRACAVRPRCVVVDTSFLSDAHGLVVKYYQRDGVHLSPEGYEAWAARLRAALDTLK